MLALALYEPILKTIIKIFINILEFLYFFCQSGTNLIRYGITSKVMPRYSLLNDSNLQ